MCVKNVGCGIKKYVFRYVFYARKSLNDHKRKVLLFLVLEMISQLVYSTVYNIVFTHIIVYNHYTMIEKGRT
jgi:hypothetical protein